MQDKSKGFLTAGTFVFLVFGLGAAVLLVLGFRSYQKYSQLGAEASALSPVSVWFENPQQNSQLPYGENILVKTKAQGPYPILYIQLETGGEVIGVVGAPSSEGATPLAANFSWSPDQQMAYTLTARAFDTMGNEAKATLFLGVVDPDQLAEEDLLAAYSPAGPHAPPGLGSDGGSGPPPSSDGPPYQPPDPPEQPVINPNEVYASSIPWSPSLTKWIQTFLGNQTAPAAPGIPATALEGCKPRIWISDNSDNEDGFRVYRRDPGMVNFAQIAVEAAYEGPVFTFEDLQSGLFGIYEYQVGAFNQAGESFSNISDPVVIDDPDCAPDNTAVIKIDLAKLFALQSYDMGYCYYSFDMEHWQRFPSAPDEFLGPGQVNQVPEELLTFMNQGDGQMLDLECWGWVGDDLQMIGKWHYDDMLGDHPDLGIIEAGDIDWSLKNGHFEGPWDSDLPVPFAFLGTTPEECAEFSNIPNPIVMGLLCADLADDLDFVSWVVFDFSSLTGNDPVDIVGYNIYDTLNSSYIPVQFIDAPATIYFPFDPTACQARLISVTLLANVDGEVHESFPSNQVVYSPEPICNYIAGNEPRMYRITWETIDFSVGNIDDGVDIDDDAEGFGWMSLETGTGFDVYWHMGIYDGFEDNDEDNPYFFAGIPLTKANSPCLGTSCHGSSTSNNTADFPLFVGESFTISVNLTDKDDDGNNDVLCYIDPYTDNWKWYPNAIGGPGWVDVSSRTKHHNNASCKVTVKIEGLP